MNKTNEIEWIKVR